MVAIALARHAPRRLAAAHGVPEFGRARAVGPAALSPGTAPMTSETATFAATNGFFCDGEGGSGRRPANGVEVISRAELAHCRRWSGAFAGTRKHHRFYELVEDTIRQGFD